MKVKNIVFDIGNVLVRWAPYDVIKTVFPETNPQEFFQKMRPVWIDWNLGKLAEAQVIDIYHDQLGVPHEQLCILMDEFRKQQTSIPGSLELLQRLDKLGLNLYSITDNIREFIEYHKQHSSFLQFFKDIIVSADVGVLKPDSRIYHCLLDKHHLNPEESVFLDDLIENVEGARAVGMKSFQFTDIASCQKDLDRLGVNTIY